MSDPEKALDTKVREELGLDPTELGSPWGAAVYSFVAFGRARSAVPFLITSGRRPSSRLVLVSPHCSVGAR